MRNHFEEYYHSLRQRGSLRTAIVIAALLHVGIIGSVSWYLTHIPERPEAMTVGIYIVPGEVKDPNKPTSVAAPPPRSGEVAPPQPAPKKEEPPKPEPPKPEPKKEEPPKPEPKKEEKPEPKKEEPKKEEKKEEPKPKTEPKPKKEEPKKEEKKKEEKKTEPKKEETKKTEAKKEPEKKPTLKGSEPTEEDLKKTEPPKKTAVKPTTGKTVDPEMDMIMGDVAEFSNETNPNGLEGPVTIQPGDMAALGLWPSRVKSQVDRTWKLPTGVSLSSTPCTLGFTVDREGRIVGTVEIITDSDNPAVTESALQALEYAKFPPLPDSYEKPTVYVEYDFSIATQ